MTVAQTTDCLQQTMKKLNNDNDKRRTMNKTKIGWKIKRREKERNKNLEKGNADYCKCNVCKDVNLN